MIVLLTGASGFVGRQALEALLRRGVEVYAVSRRRPDTAGTFEWYGRDLLDRRATVDLLNATRPDCVLHLAWYVQHGKFWTAPENEDWKRGTLALAAAAADAGVHRFVGAGTCYEYDWPDHAPCHESATPLGAHTPYDRVKNETRIELEEFCGARGLSFAWARLFFSYGPYESPGRLVPSIARALLEGRPAETGSGRAVRDFMDVRDVGEALAMLALSKVEGPVNVGSGEPVSVADVVRKLGDLSGRPDLPRLGALPDREGEPPFIVADILRLTTEVGYVPSRGLEEGLRDTLSFWSGRSE